LPLSHSDSPFASAAVVGSVACVEDAGVITTSVDDDFVVNGIAAVADGVGIVSLSSAPDDADGLLSRRAAR
jgi:hypothetical protein